MADKTGIEWTDATWTPIRARNRATGKIGWHCEHASPGCANCYSETFNERRLGTGLPFKPGHRADVEHFLDETMLLAPLRWRRPRRIFVCSMTDLFGDWVQDAWIDRVFAVMALAPQHTFQVLTKRSARMRAYFAGCGERADVDRHGLDRIGTTSWRYAEIQGSLLEVARAANALDRLGAVKTLPLPNLWLGVSAEDQRRADERVPDLLATPAAVRFVSAEPLLGPVDLSSEYLGALCGKYPFPKLERLNRTTLLDLLDWIIVGGESGPGARPMHPDWARSLRDQCAVAGVPFHFKQWGAWVDEQHATAAHHGPGSEMFDRDGRPRGDRWHFYGEYDPIGGAMIRIGKKASGRLLDGVEHNGMPHLPGASHA